MMVNRCGIYSFPKSGNTWLRMFLTNLFDEDRPGEIVPEVYHNNIDGKPVTDANGVQWSFYKSHGKNELVKFKGEDIQNDLIIYIIRNPLDVFCSQLNYLARGFIPDRGGIHFQFETAEEALSKGYIPYLFSAFTVFGTLMPAFNDAGSWIHNVTNWIEKKNSGKNVLLLRYENLLEEFESEIQPLTNLFGVDKDQLNRAIDKTANNTNDGGKFFWKKSQRTYKSFLSDEQVEDFCRLHQDVLAFTGYDKYYQQKKYD